jgi:hypothetical protein
VVLFGSLPLFLVFAIFGTLWWFAINALLIYLFEKAAGAFRR